MSTTTPTQLSPKIVQGESVRDYAFHWISGACPLHQWCSGAIGVTQEVVDYATRLIGQVEAKPELHEANDLAGITELRDYLQAHVGAPAEKYVPDQWKPLDVEVHAIIAAATTGDECKTQENLIRSIVTVADQYTAALDAALEGDDSEKAAEAVGERYTYILSSLCGLLPNSEEILEYVGGAASGMESFLTVTYEGIKGMADAE